jgi:YD repeat-containing protein
VKGIRLVGAIVVLLLALGSSIALAEQTEGETQGSGSLPSGAESLPERTANSETFGLPDGSLEARIYPAPVNYRDEEGNWRPINEDLQEGDASALANGQNSFDLALPEQLDAGVVRISTDEGWISSQLLGADTQAAEVQSNSASYEAAHGDLEFQLASLANGLKEDIVLADASQPSKFSYLLRASAGLAPERGQDGSIVFLDGEGERVFVLPAPIMLDSQPGFPAISDAIAYDLAEQGAGEWLLTIEADREWIESPDRTWPIRLDPSLTVPTPSLDCDYLLYNTSTSVNVGCGSTGFSKLRAQYKPAYNGAAQERERSVLKFDTSSIPSGAIVSEATVGLFAPYEPLNPSGIELRRVTQGWDASVTWTKANATTSWTTAGGTFNAEGSEILASERKELEGWWNFSKGLAPIVQGWVSGTMSNQGLLIKLRNEEGCVPPGCTNSWAAFNSSAATDSTKRPYLSVVYGLKPSATTEAASSVGETTATLKGQVNPNGAATTYQFEYGTTTSYGSVAPASPESIGSGTANVAASKAISGLKGSTTYHYRVSATNASGKTVGEDKTFTTTKLPTATTEAASGVKEKEATLKGSVNPNGYSTTYQFEYGKTTSYGTKVPTTPASAGSGTTAVAVSKAISGLEEGITYHYRVVASNAAGTVNGSDKTLKTTNPPQTTITSILPTYTNHEESSVEFKSSQSGSTFKCGLDEGKTPTKTCMSPYALPEHLKDGWHTFVVAAVNSEGQADQTPGKWDFDTGNYPTVKDEFGEEFFAKLTSPEDGKKTGSYLTLKSTWGGEEPEGGVVTGITYQMQLRGWDRFEPVPAECVINGKGKKVSWPLPATGEGTYVEPVFLKIKGCAPFVEATYHPEKEIKFRAVFDGTKLISGATEPSAVDFARLYSGTRVPTDATQAVGPASLDLVTGAFTVSRTDVSISVPGTEANLEFTRVYNSSWPYNEKGWRGAWQPSMPMEAEYEGQAWDKLVEQVIPYSPPVFKEECWIEEGVKECEKWEAEEAQPEERWIELISNEGGAITFEIVKEGAKESYKSPDYAQELQLTREGAENIVLSDPNGTHTSFILNGSREYLPKAVSFQATPTSSRMVYTNTGTEGLRLARIIAPSQTGITCGDWTSIETAGCRTLVLEYLPDQQWTKSYIYPAGHEQLASIKYYNASGNTLTSKKVAEYNYDTEMRLTEAWDPRLPALKEKYTYKLHGFPSNLGWADLLTSMTPPGQAPWEFGYTNTEQPKLTSVSRARLIESEPTATTTIAYEVPVSGEGAPYDLSFEAISEWGQSDLPVEATAIFPPSAVPGSEPPSDYSQATVHYFDPDGYEINTASPSPPGVEGDSIATSEVDILGNVVRTLSPQNRLLALAAGSGSVARSKQLDTQSTYSGDGTRMLESLGPLHKVRLESGSTVEARARTVLEYDQGFTPKGEEPSPNLPTKETTTAKTLSGENLEPRVSETKYNWTLRKPTEMIEDAGEGGLKLRTRVAYDEKTGLPIERSLPAKPEGGDAHTTRTIYYTAGPNTPSTCGEKKDYAGLPCMTLPASWAPGKEGLPEPLVTRYAKYSTLDQPEEVIESPGGKEEAEKTRKRLTSYDLVGREVKNQLLGGGKFLWPTLTFYDSKTGLPVEQALECLGFCENYTDTQSVTVAYDELGRPVQYTDADGNTSTTK